MKRFEQFEHTADIGIDAYGRTLAEAFGNAAAGMFDIIVQGMITPVVERKVELSADDSEQLLYKWLAELLYLHGADGLVFSEFDVMVDKKEMKLWGRAWGEPYKPGRHQYETEIKAVTYHMLLVEEGKEGNPWRVRVLFDI